MELAKDVPVRHRPLGRCGCCREGISLDGYVLTAKLSKACLPTFTLTQRYALAVCTTLARHPRDTFVPVEALSAEAHVPRAFLSKVLQALSEAGVVEGRKGHHGGYRLFRPAGETVLSDVVLPFCGQEDGRTPCVMGARPCSPANPCSLHTAWGGAMAPLRELMSGWTLADVLAQADAV